MCHGESSLVQKYFFMYVGKEGLIKEISPFISHRVPVAQLVERVLWIPSLDGNVRWYLLSTFNGEVGSSSLPWYKKYFFLFFSRRLKRVNK